MITFETQEQFDAAIMAAVEKYLQVAIDLKKVRDYGSNYYKVGVSLTNDFSQTKFSESEGYT